MKMFVRAGGQRGWGSCKMGDVVREGGGYPLARNINVFVRA